MNAAAVLKWPVLELLTLARCGSRRWAFRRSTGIGILRLPTRPSVSNSSGVRTSTTTALRCDISSSNGMWRNSGFASELMKSSLPRRSSTPSSIMVTGIARCIGDQRLFAETLTRFELRKLHVACPRRGAARYAAMAFFNDVITIGDLVLVQDHLPRLYRDLFHALEQVVEVRARQALKQRRLEPCGLPIRLLGRLGRSGVDVFGDVAVDDELLRSRERARGHVPRKVMGKGITRRRSVGALSPCPS